MYLNIKSLINQYTVVCGVDEAGRGPLAGPVYAASVILGPGHKIIGLKDSKKISPKKRSYLADEIKKHALAWAVSFATVTEIDQLNILQASLLAMKRAISNLPVASDIILVDGKHCPQLIRPVHSIVRGDSLIPEISAASILAKTARDNEMLLLHQRYPVYGFDQHKGYPTKKHLAALRSYGVSPIHRRSYTPVKTLIKFT